MNCRKVQNLISAYIDSELTGVEMLAIRDHVSHCANCDNEYKSLLKLKRSFGRMSSKQPSDDLAFKICSQLILEQEVKPKNRFSFPKISLNLFAINFRYAAVGAGILSVLLLLSMGTLSTNNHRTSSEYHMELSSLINDERNMFTSFDVEQPSVSSTRSINSSRRFNMPWGLSNKTNNPSLLSHDTRMVLASY